MTDQHMSTSLSNSYQLTADIKFTINPWYCRTCSYLNQNHPFCCECCHDSDNGYSVFPEAEHRKDIDKISKLRQVFSRDRHILLPALSNTCIEDFLENMNRLQPYCISPKDGGGMVSGVFLLSDNMNLLAETFKAAKQKYPDLWIGVNLLGSNIINALQLIERIHPDGLWVDNAYLFDINQLGIAELMLNQFDRIGWRGLYFGGVMFKYQQDCNNFLSPELLHIARQYIDVVTTTGDATGVAIRPEKLQHIRKNSPCAPIAVASGISACNIVDIDDSCDIFIVRTSIVDDHNLIDVFKLKALLKHLSSY